jgi:hypothetical protein
VAELATALVIMGAIAGFVWLCQRAVRALDKHLMTTEADAYMDLLEREREIRDSCPCGNCGR